MSSLTFNTLSRTAASSSRATLRTSSSNFTLEAWPLLLLPPCRCQQIRLESTTRRMTKALRLHPHHSFVGTASTLPSKSTHGAAAATVTTTKSETAGVAAIPYFWPPSKIAAKVASTESQAGDGNDVSASGVSSDSRPRSIAELHKIIMPTIIYNPPSAPPNPYITPKLFLPREDPRFLIDPISPTAFISSTSMPSTSSSPADSTEERTLPPALNNPYQKTYHLNADQISRMQRLRVKDPVYWTRKRLADMFGCSEFFVGFAAPTTEERKSKLEQQVEAKRKKWGKVKKFVMQHKKRKRELWYKDA